jgi:tetratricopeptide (TPR) repeat protein
LVLVLAGAAVGLWLARPWERGIGDDPGASQGSAAAAAAGEGASERVPVAPEVAPGVATDPGAGAAATTAAELEERRFVEMNDRAVALIQQGDYESAVSLLERCHSARPGKATFRRNLAESLVRLSFREHGEEGSLAAAVQHLERALSLVPERPDVDNLGRHLVRWRKELELEGEHWIDRSNYFALSYDGERRDLLSNSQEVLDHLDAAYLDLLEWFGTDVVRERGKPLRVVLLDRDEFDSLTGLGHWADGVFDGDLRVAIEDLTAERARWKHTLRHELVHAFVHHVGGADVPIWLNEGLAQWLQSRFPSEREAEVVEARKRLAGQELFPLEELGGGLSSWQDTKKIELAYAESLALVDFIREHYGANALRKLLVGAQRGEDVAQTFEDWTRVPLSFVFETLQGEL